MHAMGGLSRQIKPWLSYNSRDWLTRSRDVNLNSSADQSPSERVYT